MPVFVQVDWHVNPFRGDKFATQWAPVAEAALDYGTSYWALLRANEGGLDFIQHAVFDTKADFDRYWYSEEIAEARVQAAGLYHVPLLPTYHDIVGAGVAGAATPSAG